MCVVYIQLKVGEMATQSIYIFVAAVGFSIYADKIVDLYLAIYTYARRGQSCECVPLVYSTSRVYLI